MRTSPAVQILEPPTDDMRRWATRLRPLLRGMHPAGVVLVTPLAHVAVSSLGFQTYLYHVFHRSRVARVTHAIGLPVVLAALLALVFSLGSPAGALAVLLLATWNLRLGAAHGMPAWGAVSAGTTLALGALAWRWADAPSSLPLHPLTALLGGSLLLAFSHAAEDVPPRVTGHGAWVSPARFFRDRPLVHGLRAAAMVVPGMLNEIWGSWRLTPLVVLEAMWALGYQPEARAALLRQVAEATAQGQPAIDCVGTGGADAAGLAYPDPGAEEEIPLAVGEPG